MPPSNKISLGGSNFAAMRFIALLPVYLTFLFGCKSTPTPSSTKKAVVAGAFGAGAAAAIAVAVGADGETVAAVAAGTGIFVGALAYIKNEHTIAETQAVLAEKQVADYQRMVSSLKQEADRLRHKADIYAIKASETKPIYIFVNAQTGRTVKKKVRNPEGKIVQKSVAVETKTDLPINEKSDFEIKTGSSSHKSSVLALPRMRLSDH